MSESATTESTSTSAQSGLRFTCDVTENNTNDDGVGQMAHGDENVQEQSPATPTHTWRRQGEGDAPEVLEPDHPLMNRFQTALKAHLERQYNRLNEEVLDLEAGIRKSKVEREELGVNLYDMQQNVLKQQKLIENYNEAVTSVAKMRQEMEEKVGKSKEVHKSEREKLNTAQKKEGELRAELESLMCLERQFADWEKDMESELLVNERISEKTKVDKKQLTEEMQKKDVFILKLMTEVANLEARLKTIDGQFELKDSERSQVGQAVADANADLTALSHEHHRLVQSWNSVIVSIHHHDKIYNGIMKDYSKLQEDLLNLDNEIEGLKKSADGEMLKNENLTLVLNKVQAEEANLQRVTAIEEEKRGAVEVQLSTVHNMLEHTEKDMQALLRTFQKIQKESKALQKEVEKLSNEKVALEDVILETLQDQVTQDKAARYLSKVLRNLRSKSKDQEFVMVNTENQLTKMSMDVECQKAINQQTKIIYEDLEKQIHLQEKELEKVEYDLSHSIFEVGKRQGAADLLLKKLERLTSQSGEEDLNPQEIKITALEKNITETVSKCEELKQFWLRQQVHIVQMANQRNEQLNNINLMRKQVLILDQKNLKIEHELECYKNEDKKLARSIAFLGNKLLNLNLKLAERRDYKDSLDKETLFTQNTYINILKDAELEAIRLQTEIHDLEQDKVQLGEALLQTQRDMLAWEKKFQMAQETKTKTNKERSKEGETGAMMCEIHRMQVRYSQLHKAQEKLIGDMEHCIAKRDAIIDQTAARERKAYKASHKTRKNFQKKLEDIQNTTKHLNNEVKTIEQDISDEQQQQEKLVDEMKSKEDQIKQLHDASKELDEQLEEAHLQKQKNFETVIRRQRKTRMYDDIRGRRHRLLFRSETSLDTEMQRQKCTNSELISMLECLLTDFPALKFPLTKITNTLRLKPA